MNEPFDAVASVRGRDFTDTLIYGHGFRIVTMSDIGGDNRYRFKLTSSSGCDPCELLIRSTNTLEQFNNRQYVNKIYDKVEVSTEDQVVLGELELNDDYCHVLHINPEIYANVGDGLFLIDPKREHIGKITFYNFTSFPVGGGGSHVGSSGEFVMPPVAGITGATSVTPVRDTADRLIDNSLLPLPVDNPNESFTLHPRTGVTYVNKRYEDGEWRGFTSTVFSYNQGRIVYVFLVERIEDQRIFSNVIVTSILTTSGHSRSNNFAGFWWYFQPWAEANLSL